VTDGGRRLRGVSGRRAIAAFQKAGYEIARISGSHYILKHPARPTISIPRHGTVKAGLLLSKVKAAGLTVEEFMELLS
jgi:predicted RNA binding protein YcfA (HicA-like mRNA interferase family)